MKVFALAPLIFLARQAVSQTATVRVAPQFSVGPFNPGSSSLAQSFTVPTGVGLDLDSIEVFVNAQVNTDLTISIAELDGNVRVSPNEFQSTLLVASGGTQSFVVNPGITLSRDTVYGVFLDPITADGQNMFVSTGADDGSGVFEGTLRSLVNLDPSVANTDEYLPCTGNDLMAVTLDFS